MSKQSDPTVSEVLDKYYPKWLTLARYISGVVIAFGLLFILAPKSIPYMSVLTVVVCAVLFFWEPEWSSKLVFRLLEIAGMAIGLTFLAFPALVPGAAILAIIASVVVIILNPLHPAERKLQSQHKK